jgi:hypothetical protein
VLSLLPPPSPLFAPSLSVVVPHVCVHRPSLSPPFAFDTRWAAISLPYALRPLKRPRSPIWSRSSNGRPQRRTELRMLSRTQRRRRTQARGTLDGRVDNDVCVSNYGSNDKKICHRSLKAGDSDTLCESSSRPFRVSAALASQRRLPVQQSIQLCLCWSSLCERAECERVVSVRQPVVARRRCDAEESSGSPSHFW